MTYESDNEDVATVDETTGEVEIVGVGEAVITATSEANDSYSFGSASYLIIVNPYVEKTPAPEGAIFFDAFNHTSYLAAAMVISPEMPAVEAQSLQMQRAESTLVAIPMEQNSA